jgi:hypothetical protein
MSIGVLAKTKAIFFEPGATFKELEACLKPIFLKIRLVLSILTSTFEAPETQLTALNL